MTYKSLPLGIKIDKGTILYIRDREYIDSNGKSFRRKEVYNIPPEFYFHYNNNLPLTLWKAYKNFNTIIGTIR